jgi:hypothetical protein
MARSWKAKRQIKRHITGYKDDRRGRDAADVVGGVLIGVCAVLLAVLLPLATVMAGVNIVFRIPDLYAFEVDRGEVLNEVKLEITAEQIGDVISDYFRHKTDDFTLTAELRGRTIQVFTFFEKARMEQFRMILDKCLTVLAGAAGLFVVLFFLLFAFGRKRLLRGAFRGSVAVYILMIGFAGAFVGIDTLRTQIMGMLELTFSGDERLLQFFGPVYRIEAAGAVIGISLILYVAIFSVARRLYWEEERLFTDLRKR